MKVFFLRLFVLFFSPSALSQNLLSNPSFESGEPLCSPLPPAVSLFWYADNWFSPTMGTPDVSSMSLANVHCTQYLGYTAGPDSAPPHFGAQAPHSGSKVGSIIVYSNNVYNSYREYLQTPFREPMVVGEDYCVGMYLAMASRGRFGIGSFGIHLSEIQVTDGMTNSILNVVPQIEYNKMAADSGVWTHVYGVVKATEPYGYLTLGNFKDDDHTPAVALPGFVYDYRNLAYYYIDDVYAIWLPKKPYRFSGNTTVCAGTEVKVTAHSNLNGVQWTLLTDTTQIVGSGSRLIDKPSTTTQYRITGTTCSRRYADTLTVTVLPFESPILGRDTTFCQGTTVLLDAGGGFQSYLWQDMTVGRTLSVTESGTYIVRTTDVQGCEGRDTVVLTKLLPPRADLGDDYMDCGQQKLLVVPQGYDRYTWSDGSNRNIFIPQTAGTYWVEMENQCGIARDSITIHSLDEVMIPNVITPNGDSYNDYFEIKGINDEGIQVTIYNKWGRRIFHAGNYENDWPIKEIETGIYYYNAVYRGCKTWKGWLHVVR